MAESTTPGPDSERATKRVGQAPRTQRLARREGDRLVLPGLGTAHSHAFQRALRARTQRRGDDAAAATPSFWSWRALMYALAERVTPEDLYDLCHFAFIELAMAGVTAVGEFHYLHHQPDGTPYDDRTLLADTVIRAARDAGLRIVLLRVAYARAGFGRPIEAAQRRFCDREVDHVLRDVDTLRKRHAADPLVGVGVAVHSVRAVPRAWIGPLAAYARATGLPLHAHVSEQRREVQECLAEHGLRPLALLAAEGAVDARFVAVHATHLDADEAHLLGAAGAAACVCRSTERDLGDGAPDLGRLLHAGARVCTGVDSHAASDPFEEARALELDERVRTEARQVALDGHDILRVASAEGYRAIGLPGRHLEDEVRLDLADPALAGAAFLAPRNAGDGGQARPAATDRTEADTEEADLDEVAAWCGHARAVAETRVAGRVVIEDGIHPAATRARIRFDAAVARLLRRA
jgi:formiminoglutamate deiminase